jgi:hypothetical protein
LECKRGELTIELRFGGFASECSVVALLSVAAMMKIEQSVKKSRKFCQRFAESYFDPTLSKDLVCFCAQELSLVLRKTPGVSARVFWQLHKSERAWPNMYTELLFPASLRDSPVSVSPAGNIWHPQAIPLAPQFGQSLGDRQSNITF